MRCERPIPTLPILEIIKFYSDIDIRIIVFDLPIRSCLYLLSLRLAGPIWVQVQFQIGPKECRRDSCALGGRVHV